MLWTVTPLTWDGSQGESVLVEADSRESAHDVYFALPDSIEGPVEARPAEICDDTKPCGCRASGLTRARMILTDRGVFYASVNVARGSYTDRAGVSRCVGCQAPE